MTMLSPLNDSPEEDCATPTTGLVTFVTSQAAYVNSLDTEDMPPLTVTTAPSVPIAEAMPLRLRDEAAVRDAVGRFAVAILLPANAPDATRDHVHANWAAAVTLTGVATYPDWSLAYIPGSYIGDALVFAVHLTTGHVFGGDTGPTVQQPQESTHHWLDRLTAEFDTHAADYSPTYVRYRDHA